MFELYSFGYKNKRISQFLSIAKSIGIKNIIDTRFNPNCYDPFWKKSNLEKCNGFDGIRYFHIKNLGNIKYFKEGEIEINNLTEGIKEINKIMSDGTIGCLLCTCKNIETCHNYIILKELEKLNICKYNGVLCV